jgi:ferrous-iron efflux pump FieF
MASAAVESVGGAAAVETRLKRRATIAAIVVAVTLAVAKAIAWIVTDSVSILASTVDSLLDIAASGLNFLAVRHALAPADAEHRFGHGKAEPLAGLGQAAFITGSAVLVILESAQSLWQPHRLEHGAIGIGVMVFSLLLTLALVAYQRVVVRKTASIAIGADSLHYFSDILHNGAVIVALVVATQLGWQWVDPLCGIGVAVYILSSAWQIARQSLNLLMDHELPLADRNRILAIVREHDEVRDVHDLRTRSSGTQIFVQMHIELDPAMKLARAHAISDAVEARIVAEFPNAEVIIHQDPEGLIEPRSAIAG